MIKEIIGRPVNPGCAIGKAYVIRNTVKSISKETVTNTDAEVSRLNKAIQSVSDKLTDQLYTLYDDVINAHLMILADDTDVSFRSSIINCICNNNVNAEYAVSCISDLISTEFSESSDEILRSRAEDISHISRMLISVLSDEKPLLPLEEPSVIFVPELSPEELFSLDPKLVLGIVTRKGSVLSHTAILAKSMGIPFISGVEIGSIDFGNVHKVAIDADNGTVYFNPDNSVTDKMVKNNPETSKENNKKGCVQILANVNSLKEAEDALSAGADGIGLFRTEYLFMNKDALPDEDEQYETYCRLSDIMGNLPVTVRTLDVGSDKTVRGLSLSPEPNPALGTRGIRFSLANPAIFKTQLKAVLRASSERTNIRLMFPMITSVSEVMQIKELIDRSAEELRIAGIPYGIPKLGIMIETPAAALISDSLSKLVDFVSIGTNDLAQYTLAADRSNDEVSEYLDLKHDAVMQLIEITVSNAHANRITAGICGELASDLSLTDIFVKYGVDELSVPSGRVMKLKQK